MAMLSIQLPDGLRSRVEVRAAESGFDSVEAYVQAMLLADAAGGPVVDSEQLEALLLERLEGPFVEADEADFQQIRQKLHKRLGQSDAGAEPRP